MRSRNGTKIQSDAEVSAHRRVLRKLAKMTQPELFEIAVEAGILTRSGKLTKPYRDDAPPSASRPSD